MSASFPYSFPFVLKIKCNTVEPVFHGNTRHLSESLKKKCSLVHHYTGFLFLIRLLGVVPYHWAGFEDRVLHYGAVTAYCQTSAACLDAFIWFDFLFFPTSAKSGIKNNRFLLSAFCHCVGRAAVPALLPICTAQLGAAMGYVLQALL